MKYLVMECHEGYAVLMDEQSRFVNAANLHYEVGQTVTEPILLETDDKPKTSVKRIVMRSVRVAAVAACLVIATAVGSSFFSRQKPTPHSVVFVTAAAEIEMELDDKGSVVRLKSDSERGKEIIKKYVDTHGKTTDRVDTSGDLLEMQIENGYISGGDTVDVYVPDGSSGFETYKSELKDRISDLDIKVNIKKLEDDNHHPHHETPTPPAVTDNKGPARETATKPTATVPTAVTTPVAPEPPKAEDVHTTAAAEPPKAPDAPAEPAAPPEKATAPEPPAHEHPEPPSHPHDEKPTAHGKEADRRHTELPLPEPNRAPEPPLPPDAPAPTSEVPEGADEKDMIDSQ